MHGLRERRRKKRGVSFWRQRVGERERLIIRRLRVQIPAAPLFTRWAILCFLITFFRIQLKCTRQFSFQISNLVHRTPGRFVNISKVFSIFEKKIDAVVSPEGKLYVCVFCHGALWLKICLKSYNLYFNNHNKRNQMILIYYG